MKIQKRSEKQIEDKTKLRILREGKQGRNEYIATCVRGLIKDIKRIRLYVWELKENYPREEKDIKCPIYNKKEDTAEYVLECQTGETEYRIKDYTPNQQTLMNAE